MNILCGDVGGTKVLLAMCDERGRPRHERRYESRAFAEFAAVVRHYHSEVGERADRACFAIAGPVMDDRARATNLPWVVDARALERELSIPRVRLINDFTAQALAVLELPSEDVVDLHPGSAVGGGPVAVLGAGTGLGEAFLMNVGGRYEVISSEGGHCDFAPTTDRQIELLRWLREKVGGRVSYERVLSGKGLANIYSFLRDRGYGKESPEVRAELDREDDPAPVISRWADRDPLCDTTMEIFCEVYGQEAGNLALKVLATGGVFVCGGIAPRNLARMQDGRFQRGYTDKGRLSPLVKAIPVRLVTNVKSGLVGAAIAALR